MEKKTGGCKILAEFRHSIRQGIDDRFITSPFYFVMYVFFI